MAKLRSEMTLLILIAMLLSGCTEDGFDNISNETYVMKACSETVIPYVMLERTADENIFTFVYSGISSYIARGKYHIGNSELILNDDNGNIYTFKIDGTDLIFDADKSAEIPKYKGFVTPVDGSVFSLEKANG